MKKKTQIEKVTAYLDSIGRNNEEVLAIIGWDSSINMFKLGYNRGETKKKSMEKKSDRNKRSDIKKTIDYIEKDIKDHKKTIDIITKGYPVSEKAKFIFWNGDDATLSANERNSLNKINSFLSRLENDLKTYRQLYAKPERSVSVPKRERATTTQRRNETGYNLMNYFISKNETHVEAANKTTKILDLIFNHKSKPATILWNYQDKKQKESGKPKRRYYYDKNQKEE
ncbi:MAG: hypothetical protein WCX65_05095 [bacterium]